MTFASKVWLHRKRTELQLASADGLDDLWRSITTKLFCSVLFGSHAQIYSPENSVQGLRDGDNQPGLSLILGYVVSRNPSVSNSWGILSSFMTKQPKCSATSIKLAIFKEKWTPNSYLHFLFSSCFSSRLHFYEKISLCAGIMNIQNVYNAINPADATFKGYASRCWLQVYHSVSTQLFSTCNIGI